VSLWMLPLEKRANLIDVLSDANETKPDPRLMSDSLTVEVQRALSTLTARESDVLGLYFGA
jgi:RNA polymerase primary sigma factor